MPSERCLSIQEMLTGQRLCHSESHNDSVLAALNQQRSDGILCDVTLIAEEQKFHAHKAVLAACSDYFRAMFSLCMVESGADEVNLHGVTSLGLKQALEFAYTGQILLEPGVIQDVLAAGSHLQLLELLNLCSHYLIQELNSFNYLDLYRLADLFNLTLLEKAVIDFLVKHLSELLKSRPEDVLTLPYCLLQEVLKSDRLTSLSEEQIWQQRAAGTLNEMKLLHCSGKTSLGSFCIHCHFLKPCLSPDVVFFPSILCLGVGRMFCIFELIIQFKSFSPHPH
ncbi:kelch-like protein 32 isoform X7 [Vulpes lagopus]|uniref:kelch-like protein 32 isoform X7 n=1 Tax=Vulpes lagopus TaxID=494514 RepID=UPI001BCA1679|nr:kelch-like protein 32 isoform X7 [Vulpes lagopus]